MSGRCQIIYMKIIHCKLLSLIYLEVIMQQDHWATLYCILGEVNSIVLLVNPIKHESHHLDSKLLGQVFEDPL